MNSVNRRHNPCLEHECHACCEGTVMTLTEADVARLESLGYRGFYRENRAGDLQLLNAHGRCVFLDGGRCVVHDHQPEGCELYPLILDADANRVVRHDFCPHADEFEITPAVEHQLRASVATERHEAAERIRRKECVG